jgi:hypothetical protein
MGTIGYIAFTLVGFVLGLFAKSLRAYSEEKGRNLATKEDIAELTKTAKEIEAKIGDQVWGRQKQWELKRDTLLETVQSIAMFKSANLALIAAFTEGRRLEQSDPDFWATKRTEIVGAWEKAQERFEKARLMTALLGDEGINDALANLGLSIRQSYSAIMHKAPEERFYEAIKRSNDYHHVCIAALRKSLGLPDGDWKDYAAIQ